MLNAQNVLETKNVGVTQWVGQIDDESLKEELQKCKHFLVDSEIENGRYIIFNFAVEIHTLWARNWTQRSRIAGVKQS